MKINITRELKSYLPHLLQAQKDNLNEADTLQRIVMFFKDVLGYDAFTEISREVEVKCKYVDLAIKIEGAVKLFVEVKAAGKKLRDRHVVQGEVYAAEGNITWLLLTNGVEWNLYHLTIDEGVDVERVFSVTLAPETLDESAEKLALIHRTSVKSGAHEKFWEHQTALSPATIGKAVFTEDVLRHIRKEIHQRQEVLIDIEDLADAIHGLLTPDAREQIGPPKIRYNKRAVKKNEVEPAGAGDSTTTPESASPPSNQAGDSPEEIPT